MKLVILRIEGLFHHHIKKSTKLINLMGCINHAQQFYPNVWYLFFPQQTPTHLKQEIMLFKSMWYHMGLDDLIALLNTSPEEFKERTIVLAQALSTKFPFWKDDCETFLRMIKQSSFETLNAQLRQNISLYTLKTIRKEFQFKTVQELCAVLETNSHPVCKRIEKLLNTIGCISASLEGRNVFDHPQKDWETFISFNKFLKKRGMFDVKKEEVVFVGVKEGEESPQENPMGHRGFPPKPQLPRYFPGAEVIPTMFKDEGNSGKVRIQNLGVPRQPLPKYKNAQAENVCGGYFGMPF